MGCLLAAQVERSRLPRCPASRRLHVAGGAWLAAGRPPCPGLGCGRGRSLGAAESP